MAETIVNEIGGSWSRHRQEIELIWTDSLATILNGMQAGKGDVSSAAQISSQLFELFSAFARAEAVEDAAVNLAVSMDGHGIGVLAAVRLLQVLNDFSSQLKLTPDQQLTAIDSVSRFQLFLLEKLATAFGDDSRQGSNKDEEPRAMRMSGQGPQPLATEVRELNRRLSYIVHEPEFLEQAVVGIRELLSLEDATVYELHKPEYIWSLRASTLVGGHQTLAPNDQTIDLLNQGLVSDGEMIIRRLAGTQDAAVSICLILSIGKKILGGIVLTIRSVDDDGSDETFNVIQTYAQYLAAAWRNILLLTETKQRGRELQVLHGRYIDRVWSTEAAKLNATYRNNGLWIERNPEGAVPIRDGQVVPMRVGGHTVGQVGLPADLLLSQEDSDFVQSVTREMGNALNAIYLLQTTNAFSNQLSLAVEVSRAAATILDRDTLIQEVVDMIRDSFNFYFVGLFLVDDSMDLALLRAGSGRVGRLLVERRHQHQVGSASMIGQAIATGTAGVEQDVSSADAFSFNHLLPDTRSQLVLPLRLRGHVTGALTVQSSERGAFVQETIDVLQSLADQLAVSIANASLFAQLQDNLEKTSRMYQASRQISEAVDEIGVYQALVQFAHQSQLADVAHVIAVDSTAPDYLISPVSWSRSGIQFDSSERFPRDRFKDGDLLVSSEVMLFDDGQTDRSLGRLSRWLYRSNKLRSSAMIPVHVENEWLATLALHRVEKDPFSLEELQPFLTLADQTAVILANQQLLKQTESLYRIGQNLSQVLSREEALEIVVSEAVEHTGAAQGRIILYDQQRGYGLIASEYIGTEFLEETRFPMIGDSIFEHFWQQQQPILLQKDDLSISPGVKELYLDRFRADASLLIPAVSQQEIIGFIALDSLKGARPFTPTNIKFTQTIVDHLTIQIENLKLLDEALSRARQLIILNQIQSRVTGILDIDGLAMSVFEQIGNLLDNTIFTLALYDHEKNIYSPILAICEGETISMAPAILSPEQALFQLLYDGEAMLSEAIKADEYAGIPALEKLPNSSLRVPLMHEGIPMGLLSIHSYQERAYSENDVQLLRSIATQTSLAIANAQLFEEIQASNAQLRQLDNLKNQFLANMSHELRTPLNSIIGFSRVILKGIDGPITKEQEEDLTAIYSSGQHLLTIINEILDMAKIEAGKMTVAFEMVDLEATSRQTLSTLRSLVDEEKVAVELEIGPNLPLIEADPVRLRQIIMNLFSNAVKYTNAGKIQLKVWREQSDVYLSVSDTGIGIAPEDYEKLFTAFEQVDNSTTRTVGGTGLGLPITRWLVNVHHGEIRFESEVNKGTTFNVKLPIRRPERKASIEDAS